MVVLAERAQQDRCELHKLTVPYTEYKGELERREWVAVRELGGVESQHLAKPLLVFKLRDIGPNSDKL